MPSPLFTLVTPTFNRAGFLGKAMESVRLQARADVEHWVVDGGSTDETAAVVARFPGTRFLSEPDRGIYDALNKGLARATGDIVGLLNSDDLYPPGTLDAVAAAFEDPAVDLVSGGTEIFRVAAGSEERVLVQDAPAKIALTPENVLLGIPAINARFFRRRFLEQHLPFDLGYRIASDREFLFRMALAGGREVVLDRVLYRYCEHAGSLTIRDRVPLREGASWEHLAIAEKHRDTVPPDARDVVRRFHARESATLALGLLAEGEYGAALEMARRGWGANASWPLTVLRVGAAAVWRRL